MFTRSKKIEKIIMFVEQSPTVSCLPVGRGEAAWYDDDVVGGGEPGPPIAATTAATGGRGVGARAPPAPPLSQVQ